MTFRIERKLLINNKNILKTKDIFFKQGFKKLFPNRIIFFKLCIAGFPPDKDINIGLLLDNLFTSLMI